MVKSMFGLGCKNNASSFSTRCPDLSAGEGQTSDSLLSTDVSFKFFSLSKTSQRPRSLTDLKLSLNEPNSSIGFFTGLLTVMVSGLSISTMPPRENKWRNRLFDNPGTLFTSSRYSLAQLGLKGDQT
ncbi:hypothetical protein [Serratia sp. M24T3]|uniref:hypothetical protein n=1 Tax=Serratia sp. M24T3 TaxID=932213 RepID=UPI000906EA65|nr:hypothetical protein [Serratia sp. M24T3]